ncbi:uncharacterized protein BO97DRAFT_471833 [Aspergillus homomorphus CBS 101889]|uniref:Altered inheritance of mitochondria protein 9, mitochondrial n=1 Tax=Aspergillus homomorphus (strain CBS 101889) TaxID=1450537 RepID=A0A395HSP9_ASPHC|nr:hypothetical protein BO97DRAFT_471833 [Aspergillus homomorphus CBS 101889]RAL10365.1 hypothetical protein BO97DRAFT_471833 [Aspergillus homomorphus CBS 101889]
MRLTLAPNEQICEEDLYKYTKHRWLYNEESELSKRYLKFNIQQLINVAITACDGASSCIRVTKCAEGLYNKAFILRMDNGSEVFAKLPNPNAGPAHVTVASEVATRELLRRVLDIPVPRVLSWSFDAHGCIHFKEVLRSLTGKAEDIHADALGSDVIKKFTIGPLTTNELWNGQRGSMNLDRGPWKHPRGYTRAVGNNEISWIKSHATPRMNYNRSNQNKELPQDGIALLEKYMDVSSYLVPAPNDKSCSLNVPWHPDLHLDNIIIDPETCQITRVVDWQSACVAPLFYQSAVPRLCRHPRPVREGWVIPERPDNYEDLSPDEQKRIDDDRESEMIHKFYEAQLFKRAPRHWDVLQQSIFPIVRKPVWLVTGVWENRDLFFLRDALMDVQTHWDRLVAGQDAPCPISFSSEEIELQAKEEENIQGVGSMLSLFQEQATLPVDGMVAPEDYDVARENCRKLKDIFIGLAKDDEEKELFGRLWPYQEPESD